MTWQELKHSKLAWSSSNLSKLTLTLILGVLPRKKMFYPETALCVYLRAKFQVTSLILTSPRRGDFTPLPPPLTSKRTPKKPTHRAKSLY